MKVCVILGAGASQAEAHSKPFVRTPPLDSTFFDLAKEKNLPGISTVKSYMNKNYGINPFDGSYRMEEVFNYIYNDHFSRNSPEKAEKAYWLLLRMYTRAIGETTNNLMGKSRQGVNQLLKLLMNEEDKPQISIINFNHDLIVEKALSNLVDLKKYSEVHWDLKSSYNFSQLKSVRQLSQKDNNFTTSTAKLEENVVKILKLHGSLNWIYIAEDTEHAQAILENPKSEDLICLNEKEVRSKTTYKPKGQHKVILPLIIPPRFGKQDTINQIFNPIWQKARRELESADKLIIFGYSFPESDMKSKAMIRRAIHNNEKLTSATVIDVNPEITSRVKQITELNPIIHYSKVPNLDQTFMI